MVLSDNQILKILSFCQKSFSKFGIDVSFPKNTDPKKTYKWRYIEKFVERMNELDLNEETVVKLIDAMVEYAFNNKLNKKNKNTESTMQLFFARFFVDGCIHFFIFPIINR